MTPWQPSSVHSGFRVIVDDSNFCLKLAIFRLFFFVQEGLKREDQQLKKHLSFLARPFSKKKKNQKKAFSGKLWRNLLRCEVHSQIITTLVHIHAAKRCWLAKFSCSFAHKSEGYQCWYFLPQPEHDGPRIVQLESWKVAEVVTLSGIHSSPLPTGMRRVTK